MDVRSISRYNSIERDPKYQEISLSDVPGAEEYLTAKGEELGGGREIYAGSCHCKAIKFACVTRRIDENKEEEMVDCACSICLGVSSSSYRCIPHFC